MGLKYAIIDIETTGGSASNDRITEIAVIVHDGERVVEEFDTLIHPERSIPRYITEITGISDEMVADAPKFYEVAREIVQLTEGCIFVAHNVNFDYGFIREEFKRLGYQFVREKICTVRFSRLLIPGLPTYSLDPLCRWLGIPNRARHRAKGDADATVLLFEELIRRQPSLGKPLNPARDPFPAVAPNISRESLSRLPEDPGLYFFHDANGTVLHLNSSRNIRQDALKELQGLSKAGSQSYIRAEDIAEVTCEVTGNELVAMLRLHGERARLGMPLSNPRAREATRFAAFTYQDQRGYLRFYIGKVQKNKPGHGEFLTEADARSALAARIRQHRLCPQLGGMEQGSGPCSSHGNGGTGCPGACCGLEAPSDYNARLEKAVQDLGFPHCSFFLLEAGRNREEIAIVGYENGNVLGFAFLDSGQGWDDPAAVKSLLIPVQEPELARQCLKKYLTMNRMAKLIPF
jgi:DNA polymerase-3 subunit epsilon